MKKMLQNFGRILSTLLVKYYL